MTTAVSGSFTPPPSNHLSQIRATDLPGWGERDEESTRTRTGTFRRLHGVGIHAYLFEQLFAQCRTAYINTHAALQMVDMLGSIPKGSHCKYITFVLSWLLLAIYVS